MIYKQYDNVIEINVTCEYTMKCFIYLCKRNDICIQ